MQRDLVIPAKAGIQYAATYRFNHCCLWNTGSSAPVRKRAQGGRWQLSMVSRSRNALRPRFAGYFSPSSQRAQGRPGACCTRGLACDFALTRTAHEHTGQREHSGLPCAMALRLTSCSPRRTALLPPLSAGHFSCQRDASTATSEPHDFTVRIRRARLARPQRPPHLTARS